MQCARPCFNYIGDSRVSLTRRDGPITVAAAASLRDRSCGRGCSYNTNATQDKVVHSMPRIAALLAASIVLFATFSLITPSQAAPQQACSTPSPLLGAVMEVCLGSGSTQIAAYLDCIGDGVEDACLADSGIECANCPPANTTPCDIYADTAGTVSNFTYYKLMDSEGNIIKWFCVASFTGRYVVHCLPC